MYQILLRATMVGAVIFASGHAGAADAPAVAQVSQDATASAARLQLRWSLVRNVFNAELPGGRSLARLALSNRDTKALPAQGWALYFNCIDGIVAGALPAGLVAEQVSGQLYRVRPAPGFRGLPPGVTLNIDYYHPAVLVKTAKAPLGPYLVYDSRPAEAEPITDYRLALMTRPEQLDTGIAERTPLTSAEMLFARNALAVDLPAASVPPVFPTPVRLERLPGVLRLASMPRIDAPRALDAEAALARAMLAGHVGKGAGPATSLALFLGKIEGQSSPEAYSLVIDPQAGIRLTGATPAGVYRGLQSLRDLLPVQPGGALALQALSISDAPRFGYRGFQLDVARNFQTKETVFRLLDLMAQFKLNKFHFHLTDDEGWRLAIKGLPELTAFGAVRGHTLTATEHLQPAYGSGPDRADPHGSGHYSRADYIAILKYAAARHIEVIPELEMPGHARAAVKAMESRYRRLTAQGKPDAARFLLSDQNDRSVYTSPQLYHDQVLNPGMDGSYNFIAHVVADVVAMHKEAGVGLRTIHMGGDELPTGAWEKSPASLERMRQHRLASSADLWDYFYERVNGVLKKHGLFTSGWEELGARKVMVEGKVKLIPNPKFTKHGFNVYVWNNLDGAETLAYKLANAGYGTILAPVTNMYFDMSHNKNPAEPGVNWGGYTDLDTVYNFIPLDYLRNSGDRALANGNVSLTARGRENILGLEGTLFTETVRDRALLDYMIMPRLLALAERAWAADPVWAREDDPAAAARLHAVAWSGFVNQLGKRVLPRLDREPGPVAYRIAPPGLKLEGGRVYANHQLPGFTMRYTVDGSEPGPASPLVTGPIADKGSIHVAAFDRNGRAGASSQVDNP